jgi:hypothetical protein
MVKRMKRIAMERRAEGTMATNLDPANEIAIHAASGENF